MTKSNKVDTTVANSHKIKTPTKEELPQLLSSREKAIKIVAAIKLGNLETTIRTLTKAEGTPLYQFIALETFNSDVINRPINRNRGGVSVKRSPLEYAVEANKHLAIGILMQYGAKLGKSIDLCTSEESLTKILEGITKTYQKDTDYFKKMTSYRDTFSRVLDKEDFKTVTKCFDEQLKESKTISTADFIALAEKITEIVKDQGKKDALLKTLYEIPLSRDAKEIRIRGSSKILDDSTKNIESAIRHAYKDKKADILNILVHKKIHDTRDDKDLSEIRVGFQNVFVWACRENKQDIVELLLSKMTPDEKLKIIDKHDTLSGYAPIHYVAKNNNEELYCLLLKSGANHDIKTKPPADMPGKTAYDINELLVLRNVIQLGTGKTADDIDNELMNQLGKPVVKISKDGLPVGKNPSVFKIKKEQITFYQRPENNVNHQVSQQLQPQELENRI